MAESTTTRLGLPRWTAGSDTLNRSELDGAMASLETLALKYAAGVDTARPAMSAAQAGAIYVSLTGTEAGRAEYGDGTTWRDLVSRASRLTLVPAAGTVGLTVRGAATNTANLAEWQQSDAVTYARVTADGSIVTTKQTSAGGDPISSVRASVHTQAAGIVGLAVRGAASQTGDLVQWQNSAGTVLGSISAGGNLVMPSGALLATAAATGHQLGAGTQDTSATLTLAGSNAAARRLTIKGAPSQSADIDQRTTDTGTVLGSISSAGILRVGSRINLPTTGLMEADQFFARSTDLTRAALVGESLTLPSTTGSTAELLRLHGLTGGSIVQLRARTYREGTGTNHDTTMLELMRVVDVTEQARIRMYGTGTLELMSHNSATIQCTSTSGFLSGLTVAAQNNTGEGGELVLRGSPNGQTDVLLDNLNSALRVLTAGAPRLVVEANGTIRAITGGQFLGNDGSFQMTGVLFNDVNFANNSNGRTRLGTTDPGTFAIGLDHPASGGGGFFRAVSHDGVQRSYLTWDGQWYAYVYNNISASETKDDVRALDVTGTPAAAAGRASSGRKAPAGPPAGSLVDRFRKLRPVSFVPAEQAHDPQRRRHSFVAEELGALVPEAASPAPPDGDGRAGVDLGAMVTISAAVLQHALDRLDELGARLTALEAGRA